MLTAHAQKPDTRDTWFPALPTMDYNPSGGQVRVAYPSADGKPRIWVKGSPDLPYFRIETPDGVFTSPFRRLEPPFFTATQTIAFAHPQLWVTFARDTTEKATWTVAKAVWPMGREKLLEPATPFTVLAYGCFEPFKVGKDGEPLVLNGDFGERNRELREVFRAVALGEGQAARVQQASRRYRASLEPAPHVGKLNEADIRANYATWPTDYEPAPHLTMLSLPPARLVIGTGDQVYMDTGYDKKVKKHPLTGWNFNNRPKPRWRADSIAFERHVESTYRFYGAFSTLSDVFARLPTVGVWDDHEIRDGWGSHGDEYQDGNPTHLSSAEGLAGAYRAARRGYLQHQFALGPGSPGTGDTAPLHQEFQVGPVRGFAFDLRSQRNTQLQQVMGEDQMKAFEEWVNRLLANPEAHGREIMIVSSMPFFKSYKGSSRTLLNVVSFGESKDDNRDGWESGFNRNHVQRQALVKHLVRLRKADIRPLLLSGDIHEGAISEVWYSCDKSADAQVLAYEIVASGLSHASLDRRKFKDDLQFFADAQRRSQADFSVPEPLRPADQQALQPQERVSCDSTLLQPCLRISAPALNFGAIEFGTEASATLHLFLLQREGAVKDYVVQTNWGKTWFADCHLQSPKGNMGFRPSLPDFVYCLPSVRLPGTTCPDPVSKDTPGMESPQKQQHQQNEGWRPFKKKK